MGLFRRSVAVLILAIGLNYIQHFCSTWLANRKPPQSDGNADKQFESVYNIFKDHVNNGIEPGASFAVYYKGKQVVNLWGGYADYAVDEPWTKDTITQIYSTTKSIAALLAGIFVDRGLLKYDDPVVKYWPEFGEHGKDKVTVRQLLSHQAGLVAVDGYHDLVKLYAQENLVALDNILAKQKPLWKLGAGHGYHTLTFGMLVEALLRRADPKHRRINQIFKEEVGTPFGIDLQIGLSVNDYHRTARQESTERTFISFLREPLFTKMFFLRSLFPQGENENLLFKSTANFPDTISDTVEMGNRQRIRSIACPSMSGFSNAAALAKLFSALANGGKLNGKQLVSEKIIKEFQTAVTDGPDKTMTGMSTSFSVGMMLRNNSFLELKTGQTVNYFGHPGYGLQVGYADPENGLAWAYTTNHLSWSLLETDRRYVKLIEETYRAAGLVE